MAIPDAGDGVRLDPEGTRRWLERVGHIAHGVDRHIRNLSKNASSMVGNDERFTAAVNLGRQHGGALDEAHALVGAIAKDIAAIRAKGLKAIGELTGADADGADGVRDAARK